jgi:hypothetical protein
MHEPLRFLGLALLTLSVAGCSAEPESEDEIAESELNAFTCTGRDTVKKHPEAPYGQLVATRADAHPGFDRFVMEFERGSVPSYRVSPQNSAQFYQDGSGEPISLAGNAGITVLAEQASGWDLETGQPTLTGPRRYTPTGTTVLREVASTGDFEGQVRWGLGLEGRACYRVFELSNPPRIVVDVRK